MSVTTPAGHRGREPAMTSSHPLPAPCQWFTWLASALPAIPHSTRPRIRCWGRTGSCLRTAVRRLATSRRPTRFGKAIRLMEARAPLSGRRRSDPSASVTDSRPHAELRPGHREEIAAGDGRGLINPGSGDTLVLQRRVRRPTSHSPPPLGGASLSVAGGRSSVALHSPSGPPQNLVGIPVARV